MGKRENVLLLHRSTEKSRNNIIYPVFVQYKLNGVRALIQKKQINTNNTLFDTNQITIESSEGNIYRIKHIEDALSKFFHKHPEIILDGEIYMHGEPLNKIIKRLPKTNKYGTVSKASLPTKDLQFHIFDIKDEKMLQQDRFSLLFSSKIMKDLKELYPIIQIVKTEVVSSRERLEVLMEEFVKAGYEGLVFRYPNVPYISGSKRVRLAGKYKKHFETECKILDIQDEGMKNNVRVIKLVLQNDINDNIFTATLGKTADDKESFTNEDKLNIYLNKNKLIGEFATVAYYERSGVDKVPMFANVIAIRNYE